MQIIVGAHSTGDAGHHFNITKEEIQNYRSFHVDPGEDLEEHEIARIIAEVADPSRLSLIDALSKHS
jgi:hypothetical protein